jgi:hypothetical protein
VRDVLKTIKEHEENLKLMKKHLSSLDGTEKGFKLIFNVVVHLEKTIEKAKQENVKSFDIRKYNKKVIHGIYKNN